MANGLQRSKETIAEMGVGRRLRGAGEHNHGKIGMVSRSESGSSDRMGNFGERVKRTTICIGSSGGSEERTGVADG